MWLFRMPFDAKDLLELLSISAPGTISFQTNGADSDQSLTTDGAVRFQIVNAISEVYGGFFLFVNSLADRSYIVSFTLNGSTTAIIGITIDLGTQKLEIHHSGHVEVAPLSGTTTIASCNLALSTGVRYHVGFRFKLNGANSIAEIKIDNSLVNGVSFTGAIAGTTFNDFRFYPRTAGGLTRYFIDSVYLNDTTGSVNNGYEGILHMNTLAFIADSADDTAWTKVGLAGGYQNIDERPYSTADYNHSQTNGQRQAYIPAAHGLTAPTQIVAMMARHVVDRSGSGAVVPYFKFGSTRYDGSVTELRVSPGLVFDRRHLHPSGALWAVTDAPEIGLMSSF